jgi:glycosyltransferase involved in cell wall biosynthesis
MKLDFLCSSGSPIGVVPPDIYGRGVGGAELALLTLAEVFARRGHEVTIYNDPTSVGIQAGVNMLPLNAYNHTSPRDALILFRTPHHTFPAAHGKKVFWSCDQFTTGDFSSQIIQYADKVVCISERHAQYFEQNYNIAMADPRMFITNLGVRSWDYPSEPVKKIPGRMIFCTVPGRGALQLADIWPQIKAHVPHASLVITSDYRLWGHTPGDHEYRLRFLGIPDVDYRGNVSRHELCRLQAEAEVMTCPNTYDEMFCIACAECAWAGAIPVTSTYGALPTTNKFGIRVDGDPNDKPFQKAFANQVARLYKDPELMELYRHNTQKHAQTDFNWDVIALLWEHEVLS